ncbi:hypothetical protein EZJ43_14175 [Pedobacter changchengzhani]|uniref:ATPase AAA-type core domain-containing protein n=1 Tax=Pedobacter changchengzhani TaxID=2529274 RepID=A0A4R5MI63_9SPHI|nr:hypothetical protein [Pedobacter changchengzhani]TDG35242.1 hypothetical protein EZJ43_14175 [Pedobacter changchengzhani]
MELHYIWVKNSGYLSQAGINLSARFVFEMVELENKNQQGDFLLKISVNPNFIPDFFDKKNVSNVTAIIGKNGAGKSSILKYIKSNLPEGLQAGLMYDLFCYSFKEKESEVESFRVVIPDGMEIKVFDETKLFSKEGYGGNTSLRFESKLSDVDYINYSYFLELNEDMVDWGGLINISTASLLLKGRKRIFEERYTESARLELLSQTSDLENLNLDEVARAIQLLGMEGLQLPFSKPKELTIEININERIFFENNRSQKAVETLLDDLTSANTWHNPKEGFLNNLLFAILVNFLIDDKKYSVNNPTNYSVPYKKNENVQEYILRFFSGMADYRFEYENMEVSVSRYKELSFLVKEFYEFFKDLIAKGTIRIGEGSTSFTIPLNDKSDVVFSKFRAFYLKVKGIGSFFNFKWRSLSTGEQSYLSFMSRFYQVKFHGHHDLKDNLVIMIDEGDACYHPEWQRKFFNESLNYLSNLFSDKNIQLIYTANTPFLSSDLPKSHVLFIEKKEKDVSIFHSKNNNREETFAANIHSLFSDSFYLDGILIGEFAKNKLDNIIKFLRNEDSFYPNDAYKKTIDIIGEPVLRRKLQDMWFEKFGLEEELIALQKRMDEIQKLKLKNRRKRGLK